MNDFSKNSSSKPIIYLIRHGETDWSKSKKHTGRTDLKLTENGRVEAKHLKVALAHLSFEKVFTSPLKRVLETCEIAGLLKNAQHTDDLLEFDYGEYEGLTTQEIQQKIPGWLFFKDGVPGGETFEEASKRADHILKQASGYTGSVALFASGHISRIIAARWIGQKAQFGQFLALSTASISQLAYEHDNKVILTWNNTSHLK